jgi:hypothetical protein
LRNQLCKRLPVYVALLLLLAACKKEGLQVQGPFCDETHKCVHGNCVEGTCYCENGYAGEVCEVEERAKFLGQFTGYRNCSLSGDTVYTIVINPGNEINEIEIRNFDNSNHLIKATLGADGSAYIPSQDFMPGGIWSSFKLSGKLMMVNNKIQLSFSIASNESDNCIWLQQ